MTKMKRWFINPTGSQWSPYVDGEELDTSCVFQNWKQQHQDQASCAVCRCVNFALGEAEQVSGLRLFCIWFLFSFSLNWPRLCFLLYVIKGTHKIKNIDINGLNYLSKLPMIWLVVACLCFLTASQFSLHKKVLNCRCINCYCGLAQCPWYQ